MLMNMPSIGLEEATFRPLLTMIIGGFGLTVFAVTVIALLHTLYIFGNHTVLYRRRQPVEGWSKRFYPACLLLIIMLLIAMWLLNVWSHRYD